MTNSNSRKKQVSDLKHHEISAALLLKNSLILFFRNYDKLLALLAIFVAINAGILMVGEHFFSDKLTDTLEPSFTFLFFNLATFYLYYTLSFSFIKMLNSSIGLAHALSYIIKRTIPIFITYLLTIFAICGFAAEIYSVTMSVLKTEMYADAKIFSLAILAIATLFFIVLSIRISWFTAFAAILEEKYYFKAIKRSFVYTRSHMFSLLTKNIIAAFVLFLPFVILDLALKYFVPYLLLNDTSFCAQLVHSVVFFVPQQLLIIVNYTLFRAFKINVAPDFAFSQKHILIFGAMLLMPVLLALAVLG